MDTYSLLREFADSWVLLGMFGFFVGTGVWAFWPSQSSAREEASMIPFRDTDTHLKPAKKACTGTCANCLRKTVPEFAKGQNNG